MYVLISKTSGAQSCLLNHNSTLSCWKTQLFLCKLFCSLWEFASIIFSAVYIPSQSKANDMPCLLSGQIIKMRTKHPKSAVFIQSNWRNEFPFQHRREYQYRGAALTLPLKVHSPHSPRPFMVVIQGPNVSNILMLKADGHI